MHGPRPIARGDLGLRVPDAAVGPLPNVTPSIAKGLGNLVTAERKVFTWNHIGSLKNSSLGLPILSNI
jgi:hypothetical protein